MCTTLNNLALARCCHSPVQPMYTLKHPALSPTCLSAQHRFQRVRMSGTVDGEASQQDLDRIAEQVETRCIVAATVHAAGEFPSGLKVRRFIRGPPCGRPLYPALALVLTLPEVPSRSSTPGCTGMGPPVAVEPFLWGCVQGLQT